MFNFAGKHFDFWFWMFFFLNAKFVCRKKLLSIFVNMTYIIAGVPLISLVSLILGYNVCKFTISTTKLCSNINLFHFSCKKNKWWQVLLILEAIYFFCDSEINGNGSFHISEIQNGALTHLNICKGFLMICVPPAWKNAFLWPSLTWWQPLTLSFETLYNISEMMSHNIVLDMVHKW